jgi:formate dehydrogenase maturation protein FdhE
MSEDQAICERCGSSPAVAKIKDDEKYGYELVCQSCLVCFDPDLAKVKIVCVSCRKELDDYVDLSLTVAAIQAGGEYVCDSCFEAMFGKETLDVLDSIAKVPKVLRASFIDQVPKMQVNRHTFNISLN